MPRTIPVTTDAAVIARKYLECRDRLDATPQTDKLMSATLSAHRIAWAVQLAEEIAPTLGRDTEPTFAAIFGPRIERVDADESAAMARAMRGACDEPGVGVEQRLDHSRMRTNGTDASFELAAGGEGG